MSQRLNFLVRVLVLVVVSGIPSQYGCTAIREVMALREVNFRLDRVSGMRLAGVDVTRLTAFDQLTAFDLATLTTAVVRKEAPMDFIIAVAAENPPQNSVNARLIEMTWTLYIDERETISGVVDREVVLPPGEPKEIPVVVHLDAIEFFGTQLRQIVEMAIAIDDVEDNPSRVTLRAIPTIQTSLGPIRYPEPITIAHF